MGRGALHVWRRTLFDVGVRATFYRAIADGLDAQRTPYAMVTDMRVVAKRRLSKRGLVPIYDAILPRIEDGRQTARALEPWVPDAEAGMLRNAEATGPDALHAAFAELGGLLTRQAEARKKLVKAALTNGALLLAGFGLMVFVAKKLAPTIGPMTRKADIASRMPVTVRYYELTSFVLDHGVALLLAAGIFIAATLVLLPRWTGRVRAFYDQYIPPFAQYQRFRATIFLSSTAAMMRSGITLKAILASQAEHGSRWMRVHTAHMREVLDAGQGEVAAISAGPLPHSTADILQMYQSIPRFQDVMTRLAEANFKAYEASIAFLSTLLGLFISTLIAALGIATLAALFQYSDAVRAAAQALH